jgi:hypothetical protein
VWKCTAASVASGHNQEKEAAMTSFLHDVDAAEMRGVARRQLKASIVVGILVIAVASLIALRSTPSLTVLTTAHSGVQQPVFVSPPDHMIASAKRRIETP